MLKRKLLYALGLLVNSSLSLTIHSTSSSSIASPSVAHPLDDNTYFYPRPTPISNCELTFSTDEYTTTVTFSDGCPTGSVAPPPNFPPTVPYGCTYFASKTYCPYNCDTSTVHYYDYIYSVTSCPEQLCIFDKSGGRPSFKCEPTTLSEPWSSYILSDVSSDVSSEVSVTSIVDSVSQDNSTWHDNNSNQNAEVTESNNDDTTEHHPEPTHPMTTQMPVTCEVTQTHSHGHSWNDVSCNYLPIECTKTTTFNVHNQTLTYIWCPSTTIELFPSGETTTTFCPYDTCYDYLHHTENNRNTRVDQGGLEGNMGTGTTVAPAAPASTTNAGTAIITKVATFIDTNCDETKTLNDKAEGGHGHAGSTANGDQKTIATENIPIYKTIDGTNTDCIIITTCPTPVTLTVTQEITKTETVTAYNTITINDDGDICIVTTTTNEAKTTEPSYENQVTITTHAIEDGFNQEYSSKPNQPNTTSEHGTEKATTTETPESSNQKSDDKSETSNDEPVDESVDKPGDEVTDKPKDKPIYKPTGKPDKESVDKPTDKPTHSFEPITSTIGNYSIDYSSTMWRNSSTLATTVVK